MIRYYGWYSNKSRGMRAKQARGDENVPEHLLPEPNPRQIRWATLIKNVYNVDPLVCPNCGAEMIIVEVTEKQTDIQWILQDMDEDSSGNDPPRGPPKDSFYTYEPFHDDLPWGEIDEG